MWKQGLWKWETSDRQYIACSCLLVVWRKAGDSLYTAMLQVVVAGVRTVASSLFLGLDSSQSQPAGWPRGYLAGDDLVRARVGPVGELPMGRDQNQYQAVQPKSEQIAIGRGVRPVQPRLAVPDAPRGSAELSTSAESWVVEAQGELFPTIPAPELR
jgi:hypothetical protein